MASAQFVAILLVFASVLLATMALGLARALRGPTPADRLMAVQLIGTASIGLLLLLGAALNLRALADVALVFSLLAAVAVAALTRRRARVPADSGVDLNGFDPASIADGESR